MNIKASLLPKISVSRPVSVAMCLLALLVVGAVGYFRIPVKLFPTGFDPPFLWVGVRFAGATPRELEQQIARPMEERLRTVKGIKQVRSYSSSRRGVDFSMRFQQDADMELAYNQVVDQLERFKPELPEDARDNVRIWKHNDEGRSIMWAGVTIDTSIVDPFRFLEAHVQRPLERIDGVAKVDVWGVDPKEVMIEIDRDRLQARGVNTYEMVQLLRTDNFALAGGHVREGGKKIYVRSMARYRSLEEIENIKVSNKGGGVRLREVANVVYDVPSRRGYERTDGEPSASFSIKAESGADLVELCERILTELKEIETGKMTSGLKFNVFFNQGQFIRESIENLRNTGIWGGFFAALVLLFFLRAFRMTSIITCSIPLCVMISIVVLYFVGWSLNMMTMMGLMVGVGLVVDNAIVILENIYRLREKGENSERAAVLGASEVAMAITMATLTTVVVFLPLMLMSGGVGMRFYMTRMGVPVIMMLVGSLFVALIFIPLASVRFGGTGTGADPKSIGWARKTYGRMLAWTLQHRRDALLLVLAIFMTIVIPSGKMKRSDSSRGNINNVQIRLHPPKYFTINDTYEVISELETHLETKREVYGIRTMRTWFRTTYGRIEVFLDTDPNSAWWQVVHKEIRAYIGYPISTLMDRKEVIKDLKDSLPKIVGVKIAVESRGGGGGDPSVSVYMYGDDTEVLAGMVDEVERRLKQIPSVMSLDTDLERATDEVQVQIDRKRTRRYGISPEVVAQTLAFTLQGVGLPRYQTGNREVPTRLYLEQADKQTLQQLKNYTFRSASGEDIPLAELATVEVSRGSGTIRREDGKTRLRVQAFTVKDDLKGLYLEIDRAMQGFEMPRGYYWNKGERYSKFQEEDNTAMFAVVMAITCVFLLMGVLFESFILPFSVLLSIPFAFLGVYWTLYLTGTPMDLMANIGVIVLIGVVVNNAIVLVDMVNRLRKDGMERTEAILEAGYNRFRPILMTTFTTVFGLLPMSIGTSSLIGIPYAPLGRTMMGGLISSTFLTLLVVPLFYTFFDDLRMFIQRIVSSAFGRSAPEPLQPVQVDMD